MLIWVTTSLLSSFSPITYAQNQRTAPSAITTTEIKLWVGGMSPALRDYEIDIFNAALAQHATEYPPYRVEYIHRHMSAERSKIETERGINIHAHYASEWLGQFVDSANVHLLGYPFMQEKLGLRKCITLKKYLPRFQKVNTEADFVALRVGQQRGWVDINVYQHRGVTVAESEDYSSMFAMLERDRFDCLPMSVLEIDRVIRDQKDNYPTLVIVPSLYIFYPIPVYLGVTRYKPELVERLARGFDELFADGTANRLFLRHYASADTQLQDQNPRLVVLKNPVISEQRNQAIIERFVKSVQVTPLP